MAEISLCATIFTVVGKLTTLHAITDGLDVIDTPLDPFLATGVAPSSNSHVSAACCHVSGQAAAALHLPAARLEPSRRRFRRRRNPFFLALHLSVPVYPITLDHYHLSCVVPSLPVYHLCISLGR
jgi:hypothetical protein